MTTISHRIADAINAHGECEAYVDFRGLLTVHAPMQKDQDPNVWAHVLLNFLRPAYPKTTLSINTFGTVGRILAGEQKMVMYVRFRVL